MRVPPAQIGQNPCVVRRTLSRILLSVVAVLFLAGGPATAAPALEVAGISVIPHTQSADLRYRREPDPQLGARVQLFVRNVSPRPITLDASTPLRLRGQDPAGWLARGDWAWHDFPSAWPSNQLLLPPGGLTCWTFNGRGTHWGVGTTTDLETGRGEDTQRSTIRIDRPQVWISAVTFLSSNGSVSPDSLVFHVANGSDEAVTLRSCRLWVPDSNATWRALRPQNALTNLAAFPADRRIPAHDKGCARAVTRALPLTYAAVEVEVEDPAGKRRSLWAHLRIKRERFDISGGWVAAALGGSNTLQCVPYLKTLKRLHVDAGMHQEVSGYTDNPELFGEYPLRYMNRFQPLEHYDQDAMLPRLHAVEFLGEPQYGGGRPVPPMEVWRAFAPYQASRLATSVTHSEERIWRLYAGLSDFPHHDAYRVTAPAPDAWTKYDRWNGETLRWGAPLETIGDMCRSLRDLNRPMPVAYWSQGAHDGWDRVGGRQRTSPTPDELRSQAYHALASRITSLYWFNLSLKSLVKFRDLLQPITEVGREIRLLEGILLEGDAGHYSRTRKPDGSPDWDLATVCAPTGAALFALDLAYVPDRAEKVFQFGPPRPGTWRFPMPSYLRGVADVFRIDATGIQDARWERTAEGIMISGEATVAGIWIAAPDRGLRAKLGERLEQLRAAEIRIGFDPARNDADFDELRRLAGAK